MTIVDLLLHPFRRQDKWCQDLCDYYGITPTQAEELGRRQEGRRPSLPASPTTHAILGMTFEEIWYMRPRDTVEGIHRFYKDMGAWATFRQCYYHRNSNFSWVVKGLPSGSKICEYGCGVAPVANWIVENVRNRVFDLTITDVASEHLTFARWRLEKKIELGQLPFRLQAFEVEVNTLPLQDEYDVITILEVFEHLYNAYDVLKHLTEHLRRGGKLWENYVVKEAGVADLKEAQEQRTAVFEHIRANYKLIKGPDPDKMPGRTRCWQKR